MPIQQQMEMAIGTFVNFICWYLIFALVYIVFKLALCIKNHAVSRIWKVNLKQRFGEWAVVTGSTRGIGRAYSYELAKRGINIIFISIGMEDLEEVSKDISEKYGVQTEILEVNFLHGMNIYKDIKAILKDKEIGILMNNVGIGLNQLKTFDKHSENELECHISVNMSAATFMSKLVVSSMLERGRGAIVNMSSMSAFHPMPYFATYAASKAYTRFLSEGLSYELKDKGISVQTVTPFYVSTAMVSWSESMTKPSLVVPSAETFAKSLVSTLGYTENTCGYYIHDVMAIFFSFLPSWLYIRVAGFIHYHLYVAKSGKKSVQV